jgi:hypothetical protein
LKASSVTAGFGLAAIGEAIAGAGMGLGGGALALAGGGSIGSGAAISVTAGGSLALTGFGVVSVAGRAEVAYSRADRSGGGGSDSNKPKNPTKIKDNDTANALAREMGYKNAETLKQEVMELPKRAKPSRWDMYRDKSDGSLWVGPKNGSLREIWARVWGS